jgi:hypothetical protein
VQGDHAHWSDLVCIEQLTGGADLAEWLEEARRKLLFKSASAMQMAVAEATGLRYSTVHKCLTPATGARRIQGAIVRCLRGWLSDVVQGRSLHVDDRHRAVPVSEVLPLLPVLLDALGTKEAVYRGIGERTGVRPGTVRRYFQNHGTVRQAPIAVWRAARDLASEMGSRAAPGATREREGLSAMTRTLAENARRALEAWQTERPAPELRSRYRRLRRDLIAVIDRRRRWDGHCRREAPQESRDWARWSSSSQP